MVIGVTRNRNHQLLVFDTDRNFNVSNFIGREFKYDLSDFYNPYLFGFKIPKQLKQRLMVLSFSSSDKRKEFIDRNNVQIYRRDEFEFVMNLLQ